MRRAAKAPKGQVATNHGLIGRSFGLASVRPRLVRTHYLVRAVAVSAISRISEGQLRALVLAIRRACKRPLPNQPWAEAVFLGDGVRAHRTLWRAEGELELVRAANRPACRRR